MMQFANTEYLMYAWWIPFALIVLWFYIKWRQRKLSALADQKLKDTVLPGHQNRFYFISGLLILGASAMVVLGLANLVSGAKPVKGKKMGLEIAIVLDVSKSMDAQDLKPSRLARSTQFISDLSTRLGGNKIGLVVFAGNAYVQMPLTSDAPAMKLFLSNTSTNMIAEQGTAIGEAIETATQMLFPNGKTANNGHASKVILLISDGENHDEIAIKAAKSAAKSGVRIYTAGVGSSAGAPVPVYERGALQGYLRDDNGETVISKLDAPALKEIATAGHGSFYMLNEQNDLTEGIVKELSSLSKGEQDFEIFDLNETRFQWFAGAALFLLLLEAILKLRSTRPYKRQNI
jgi:Ca-activated chloride channel family protein